MALIGPIPALVTGLVAVNISTERTTSYARDRVFDEAEAHAAHVARWLDDQVQALQAWTRVHRIGPLDDARRLGLVRSIFIGVPTVASVWLVDEHGVPVLDPVHMTEPSPPDSPLAGRIVADRDRADLLVRKLPVTQAIETARGRAMQGRLGQGEAVGVPYRPVATQPPSVPIAVVGAGEDLVIGAEVSLAPLSTLLDKSSPQHGIALFDAQGKAIFGGNHPLVDESLLQGILGTPADIDQLELKDGSRAMGAVAPVAGAGWTVVVVEPTTAFLGSAELIRRRTAQVLIASVVIALLIGILVAQSESRPIAALRDSALEVADGHYGSQTRIDGSREINELARAFNHMSARLALNRAEIAAQQQEIEAFNRELQDRVEARTQQLREAQQQLVRSGQLAAVAEVGAGLAHELNNPLAGILGLTQLLRATDPADENLEAIEEQAVRCREVVATMLRFSSGEVDPANAPVVDLRDVLRDVVMLVRGPFRQRGVKVELEDASVALPIRIDPVQGSRLFAQILNGLRAGLSEGASLVVRARLEGGEVVTELVPDRVVGIETRDDYRASSMGLWVSRRILDQLGGRLEEPGQDERIWRVRLPVEASA